MKRALAALLLCLLPSLAQAWQIPYASGPQDPSQLQAILNGVIQSINAVSQGPYRITDKTIASSPLTGSITTLGGIGISPPGQTPVAIYMAGSIFENVNHDPTNDTAGFSIALQIADIDDAAQGFPFEFDPAAGGAVLASLFIDNLGNRKAIWALNIICAQGSVGAGGGVGIAHCIEGDVSAGQTQPSDPYGLGATVHFIEPIAANNTDPGATNPGAAIWIWSQHSASNTTTWWGDGITMARVLKTGLYFGDDTVDGDADGSSFTRAAIEIHSSAARGLYFSGGASPKLFDLSGLTNTNGIAVLMPAGSDSIYRMTNGADHGFALTLDSGISATQNTQLKYSDQAVDQWVLRKFTNDHLQIFDVVNSAVRMDFDQVGDLGITAATTVTGVLGATSYKVGSTAGASCTLTTVSHLTVVGGLVTLCN